MIWSAEAPQATAVSLPGAASALIFSPSTSTSAGTAPVGDTTVPPWMSRLMASLLLRPPPVHGGTSGPYWSGRRSR